MIMQKEGMREEEEESEERKTGVELGSWQTFYVVLWKSFSLIHYHKKRKYIYIIIDNVKNLKTGAVI